MPVNFDEYRDHSEASTELPIDPDSNAFAILAFLAEHPELGFKPSEIHEQVDVPKGSLNPTLARLEERDLVEHEAPYWSVAADDRVAAMGGSMQSMQAFEAHHGDDDFSGWHESDVDPRETR